MLVFLLQLSSCCQVAVIFMCLSFSDRGLYAVCDYGISLTVQECQSCFQIHSCYLSDSAHSNV